MAEPNQSTGSIDRISELSDWETSTLEIFVRAVGLVGLPRSVGEIYGVLFCATGPLTFDEITERLGISRGSVSQGLKLLRQLGAVKLQYIPSSRKDHYIAELSIKRLMRGFVKDQFKPHLESGQARIEAIEQLIDQEVSDSEKNHARKRVATLRVWQQRMRKLMPVILAVLGGASVLMESDDQESDRQVI
ncbi:MAG: MarR family transcriptional regulator [Verrucomicrobiota bacterium]